MILKKFIGLAAAIAIGAMACTKSGTSSYSQGNMSATVGGVNFKAGSTVAAYSSVYNGFAIVGYLPQGSDTTFVQLNLPLFPPVGHPFATDSTLTDLSYRTTSGSKAYDAYSGYGHALVTISSWDSTNHTIIGTFSGVLLNDLNNGDSVVITNGTFNTQYTAQ